MLPVSCPVVQVQVIRDGAFQSSQTMIKHLGFWWGSTWQR